MSAEVPDRDLDEVVAAVHRGEYLEFLRHWSDRLSDGELYLSYERSAAGVPQDTPLYPGVFTAAREGARTAMAAAEATAAGHRAVYALCRPPGHHAGPDWHGGYCFLNNAMVAVEVLTRHGRQPAVLDLDFHVGNGTAALLAERPGHHRYASVHAATADHYPWCDDLPGVTREFCLDLTVPPTEEEYLAAVAQLTGRLADAGADTLVISLGFDTVAGDPHGTWSLRPATYAAVASTAAGPGWPVCVVQEGGYRLDSLAACAQFFGQGLAEATGPQAPAR